MTIGRPSPAAPAEQPPAAGTAGRESPVSLDGIHVFDVVGAARARRTARGRGAADRRGSARPVRGRHRRLAPTARRRAGAPTGADRGAARDRAGARLRPVAELRAGLADPPGVEIVPLWLRGRATGVLLTLGRPRRPLAEIARQAAAAITLADRYTDTFARGQRRKQPLAAAEIQQSLLPPRISRVSGGEMAGHFCPATRSRATGSTSSRTSTALDHAGRRPRAQHAGGRQQRRRARSAARQPAQRREHQRGTHPDAPDPAGMPGPAAEMTAIVARWDPATSSSDRQLRAPRPL